MRIYTTKTAFNFQDPFASPFAQQNAAHTPQRRHIKWPVPIRMAFQHAFLVPAQSMQHAWIGSARGERDLLDRAHARTREMTPKAMDLASQSQHPFV